MYLRPWVAALLAALPCKVTAFPSSVPEGIAEVDSKGWNYLRAVLDNIGPQGSEAKGVSAGIIIASPSTENPNCTYILV
jgi:glucoamylase